MAAPQPAASQITRDIQVHGLATFSSARFAGGGLGFAVRPPGRLRFGGTASAGDMEGVLAGRGEAFLAFHLNPGAESGIVPYGSAGVAVNVTRITTQGYLQLLLGLEQRPGRTTGWFVEAGVGGGLRVAAGYRFRSGSGIRR